ncbi:MAG: deoxyguanosinetriphosphate triphosphohydrolase [Chloroflexi bacterium]|nr:deoxyguanosinetriphosphate triphosphohydrolase [Chloroflexota bacterium]
MNFRRFQEERELKNLSPRAAFSAKSRGRVRPEEEDPTRTCYQRDRDRIIYSKAFRRLMHKTQVFISPEGDHYRTRLTHTLEVSQIARSIARGLLLNEDLAEAVALGHDIGHAPFGHAGEYALDEVLVKYCGERFAHPRHSIRIVDHLERPGGLNLTYETRDGIAGHSKGRTPMNGDSMPSFITLEGEVVFYSDRVAYINHDIDDALRSGLISLSDIPPGPVALLGDTLSVRVNRMVQNIVNTSRDSEHTGMSRDFAEATDELKEFLFKKVYVGSEAKAEEGKAQRLLKDLFEYFMKHPEGVPESFFTMMDLSPGDEKQRARAICDYIAGMSDRYALQLFDEIFVPRAWRRL